MRLQIKLFATIISLIVASFILSSYAFKDCRNEISSPSQAVLLVGGTVGEMVDLGLPSGTLWADHNLGAAAPQDYGAHIAWGEKTAKETYTRDNLFDINTGGISYYTQERGSTYFYEGIEWFFYKYENSKG